MWCVPELNEEFVERMEDVLTLYEKPYDPLEPVVCLDEKPVQCLEDKRRTVRVRNGSVRRDYEYVRRGTANVFCGVEPKAGKHFTKVTKSRKKPDFARSAARHRACLHFGANDSPRDGQAQHPQPEGLARDVW